LLKQSEGRGNREGNETTLQLKLPVKEKRNVIPGSGDYGGPETDSSRRGGAMGNERKERRVSNP